MTAKEIYEIIDLNELPKEKADKLRELEVKTKGFSIQNDRVDETMRNLYAQLKEKKPSALKDLKVEIKKVETKKGDDVIIKETEEIVGKKKVTQKNPTPSSSKKETITEVAKKIRKEGEEWRQALKRAGEEMRKREVESSKQVKTELQKLVDFVKNDPNFKDFPRTYGKGRKDIDLLKDASEKALAPGRRVSKKGHMNQYGASKGGRKYTENRDNRSDREASKFPKNIFLAKGGSVHRAELMQDGGEVFVPVQILANNPDALVNTTTMSQLFAEGGMAPTRKLFEDGGALYQSDIDADYITYGEVLKSGGKLKYDPARDVQAIVIQDGPFKKMFIKGDFLGGAYRLASGGLSENYIYVSPRKVIFARLKSGEDIKPSNGFWIKKNASGTIYTGKEKAKPAFKKTLKFPLPKVIKVDGPYSQNEKIMKMLGTFSANEAFLRPALSFVRIQEGELISTNAFMMIRLYDNSVEGKNEFVCASNACKKVSESERKELSNPGYKQVLNSAYVDFSEKYNLGELYEALMGAREEVYSKLEKRSKNTYVVIDLELKNNSLSFDSMLLLTSVKAAIELGWKNAYISYQEGKTKAIYITEDKLTTNSSYAVLDSKDVILIMPIATSAGFENVKTIEVQQVMADGGEVFVPVQVDANNPDVLVQTTTMSDLFADGGMTDDDEGVDLFEDYEDQPEQVQAILAKYELEDNDYNTLNELKAELEEIGYTFEFDLDAEPYDLRKVGQKGKSEFYAKGGIFYDSQGNLKAKKQYESLSDYEKDAKKGDVIWVGQNPKDFQGVDKSRLYRVVEINNDGDAVLAPFGRKGRYTLSQKNQVVIVVQENDRRAFAKGGFVGKGEMVWRKLTASKRIEFLYENFTPQITPRTQEILVKKDYQFLPREVKMTLERVYANVEEYAEGGRIGFEALSKKVSSRYVGKRVKPEYQDEYGKTYSKEEADEVGDKVAAKVYRQQQAKMAEGGFVAMYGGKKINIEADSLYAAKLKAIEEFKVPKSKQGLLSVVSNKSMANQDFRFMADGGRLEAQSLEMAQNISVQIAHHAMELKEALEGKTYIEPWVTSMLQRAADNLSDATHYLEGKHEEMAKGGEIKVGQFVNIVDNPFWEYSLGKKGPFKRKVKMIDNDNVFFTDGSNSSMEYIEIPSNKSMANQDTRFMAKGGKIREFDDVLVISKNKLGMVEAIGDNIYYVTTPFGETIEATMDDLKKVASFKEGGDVKIGEIATLAKENNATGDQVVKKISAGADVEMEHTEDRKVAMRIAVDHLKEDFNYYEKLRKAGL